MSRPVSRPRRVPARLLPFRVPPDARGQAAGHRPQPGPTVRTQGRGKPERPAPRRLTSLAGFFRPRA